MLKAAQLGLSVNPTIQCSVLPNVRLERYSLTGKTYPKRLTFRVVGYSSSTWYEHPTARTGKRGRKPRDTDNKVLQEIKIEIGNNKFNAEGYMKVKKRMEKREINPLIKSFSFPLRVDYLIERNAVLVI